MGLLDVRDELLTIYSLVGRQEQNLFPLLCKAIASALRASGKALSWRLSAFASRLISKRYEHVKPSHPKN